MKRTNITPMEKSTANNLNEEAYRIFAKYREHCDHRIMTTLEGKSIYYLHEVLNMLAAQQKDFQDEIRLLKEKLYEGIPQDCVHGWDEVKFCPARQGEGGECKWCI